MKVLIISRYSRLGASSRLRFMQYVPDLVARGFDVEVMSLFDDAYLTNLYAGCRLPSRSAVRYVRHIKNLLKVERRPDVIWLEKEVLPWAPWQLEQTMLPRGVPVVADYDDAVFHRYDKHRLSLVRWLLGNKIDRVMENATLVIAGNSYLAYRARAAGARAVEIVPTVVDAGSYQARRLSSSQAHPRIGWIGTPETWSVCVSARIPMLRQVLEATDATVLAVGALPGAAEERRFKFVEWSEADEIAQLQQMDIGIMPLPDTPWMRGKCAYKLVQYMGCGLPVVASPVGVNKEVIDHGVNGFLAETDHEWEVALKRLIEDPDLRHRMGAEGRKKVEKWYSLEIQGPRVAEILRSAAAKQVQRM